MTRDELTYRPFTATELPEASTLLGMVFGEAPGEEDLAAETLVQEPGRSQAAFDGSTMVGCLGTYSFSLSVPGGAVPCAGLTWVAVAPTHRRKGVLTAMMTRHLAEVDEPVAALWASEAAIYGRYGYGIAAEQASITLTVQDGLAWAATAPPMADGYRLVPLDSAVEVLQPIYEACRARRGAMHARSPDWWRFQVLSDRPAARGGAPFKKVAVASIDDRDVAYAVYGLTQPWGTSSRPDGSVRVVEMCGVDAAAEAAMWRYLASHDLCARVSAFRRPIDDPLPLLLDDPRLAARQVTDSLHVRIMDVAAALEGRTYFGDASLVVDIHDPLVSGNTGRWHCDLSPGRATVQATDAEPDLGMDIRTLGSMYLGGLSVPRLAAAGQVTVHNPTVANLLDVALRPASAPWAPEIW